MTTTPSEEITVAIKVATGKRFEVSFTTNMTVYEAKVKAENLCEIPPAQQRYIYRGRILKDAETLGSYGISTGHTIHLVRGRADPPPTAPEGSTDVPSGVDSSATVTDSSVPTPASAHASLTNLLGAMSGNNTGGLDNFASFAGGFEGFSTPGVNTSGGVNGGFPGGMNPQMFQNLMTNPMIQNMMQEIMANPDMLRNVIQANPFLNQMASNNPVMQSMLSNPDLLRSAMNADVLQSAMGLQQTLHRNQTDAGTVSSSTTPFMNTNRPPNDASPIGASNNIASNLMSSGGGAPIIGGINTSPPVQQSGGGPGDFQGMMQQMMSNPEVLRQVESAFSNMSRGNMGNTQQPIFPSGGVGGYTPGTMPLGGGGNNAMADMLGRMFGTGLSVEQNPTNITSPSERFQSHLQQLEDMGFIDKDANLLALQRTGGDVNAAISWLLESGHGS